MARQDDRDLDQVAAELRLKLVGLSKELDKERKRNKELKNPKD